MTAILTSLSATIAPIQIMVRRYCSTESLGAEDEWIRMKNAQWKGRPRRGVGATSLLVSRRAVHLTALYSLAFTGRAIVAAVPRLRTPEAEPERFTRDAHLYR